ncbi:PadR family transcriptional regulator [Oscillibacter valericigenes]|nr:PadR family transcriptional regulator [Oscillibacter valericigenes]
MGAAGPMTEAMYYILLTLTVPSHGYQLMSAVTQASRGRVQMGPGTLYGVLTRLETEKLIEIVSDDGRRKVYAITESGRAALRMETERLRSMLGDQERWKGEMQCLTE